MSRYRKVLSRIWQDDKFPGWSFDGRLLFLYHLTSPNSSPFLLYVEGPGAMGDGLRMPSERLRQAMGELAASGSVWYADDGSNLVFLPKALALKENAPESPNAVKMWLALFADLPKTPFLARCLTHWEGLTEVMRHAMTYAFLKALATPSPISEQEQEQEQEKKQTGATAPSERARNRAASTTSKASATIAPAGFDAFWAVYPRRVGRADAMKAWVKISPTVDLQAQIMAAVAEQKTWPTWTKDSGQFIPHPAKWIRGRLWEDEPPAAGLVQPQVVGVTKRTAGNVQAAETWLQKASQP